MDQNLEEPLKAAKLKREPSRQGAKEYSGFIDSKNETKIITRITYLRICPYEAVYAVRLKESHVPIAFELLSLF